MACLSLQTETSLKANPNTFTWQCPLYWRLLSEGLAGWVLLRELQVHCLILVHRHQANRPFRNWPKFFSLGALGAPMQLGQVRVAVLASHSQSPWGIFVGRHWGQVGQLPEESRVVPWNLALLLPHHVLQLISFLSH